MGEVAHAPSAASYSPSDQLRFLGYRLAATGRSLEELAEALGCTLETLDHLRNCRLPRPEGWVADLSELAEAIGVDREGLAELLR
jgi:hypothetical protein